MTQEMGLGRAATTAPLVGMVALVAALACLGCGDDSGGGGGPMVVTPGPLTPTPATPPAVPTPPGDGTAGAPATPPPGTPPATATPPTTPPAASGAPTFTAIFDEIMTVGAVGNCMFGACHGGAPDPMLNGNLKIAFGEKDAAYAGLVGVVSTSTLCAGMPLVTPGDSAGSLLIQKLGSSPPCGLKMPIGTPLTDAQVAQIATWIDNGALND